MTDPRNIAHDKKVQQEKKHNHEEVAPDAAAKPQPGRKPQLIHHASDIVVPADTSDAAKE